MLYITGWCGGSGLLMLAIGGGPAGWGSGAAHDFAVVPGASTRQTTTLYAATEVSLYKSLDGGATWQTSPTPPCDATLLLAHPTKSRVLFADCKNNGLYRSDDGGQHWTSRAAGASLDLVADESTPGRLLWKHGLR